MVIESISKLRVAGAMLSTQQRREHAYAAGPRKHDTQPYTVVGNALGILRGEEELFDYRPNSWCKKLHVGWPLSREAGTPIR